jgi:hypothetical protein
VFEKNISILCFVPKKIITNHEKSVKHVEKNTTGPGIERL